MNLPCPWPGFDSQDIMSHMLGFNSRPWRPTHHFDPNAVGIARESERVPIFFEGLHLRMRPFCNDFPKRLVDVAHSECEVVQLLPFAIASEELAVGGIPVEF